MSSILDALRKVEAEKTKKKVDLREIEEVLAEKDLIVPDEGEPAPRDRRPKRAVIVLALVAVTVVFGVATFFVHNALLGGPSKEVTESQAAFPGRPEASSPAIPQRLESVSPEEPAAVTPAPPASETNMAVQSASPPDAAVSAASTPSKERTAQRPARRPALRINILRPPSEQFPKGLAVVNGKKVGVGDRVGGAEVIKIQEDGIVFDSGDDLFLVKF